jgi:non-ribosomal peptide synthase protein (TIGR01720 family)
MSRLNTYGLKLEMRDLFKHPVIEELAGYVQATSRRVHQGTVEGEIPATPIQAWLYEQNLEQLHHFNQAVMLYRKDGFEEAAIRSVLSKLVEHHDILRMTVKTEDGHILQYNRGMDGELFSLEMTDLKDCDDYRGEIERESNRLQGSMDLRSGPLMKAGLFKTKEGDHLLIAIHHLAVDGVSWRIILEDLAVGYRQALNKKEVAFGSKTDSFKYWAEKLQAYANGRELLKEAEYWNELEQIDIPSLPADSAVEERRFSDSAEVVVELGMEETESLLKRVNKAYNTEINDLLLAALGLAVREWTGNDKVLVNLEGHGREEILKDIDISRTVGWFTTQYPVVLDMAGHASLPFMIKSVKEGLRHIPNKGIGYGILKYLTLPENRDGLDFRLKPEISFNYLGQFDQRMKEDIFRLSDIPVGQSVGPNIRSEYRLDINGAVQDGRLIVRFAYNQGEYEAGTIGEVAGSFMNHLAGIISHCAAMEDTEATPSDFTINDLTLSDFEAGLEHFE